MGRDIPSAIAEYTALPVPSSKLGDACVGHPLPPSGDSALGAQPRSA
jgi:hypothetical protein